MIEGEAVENHPTNFHPLTQPRQRTFADPSSVLVLPKQVFDVLIRHQIQALIFVKLFIKKKFRAPSAAASRNQASAAA
ncbi:hypothetical protein, partial [Pedobacter petrophilus]